MRKEDNNADQPGLNELITISEAAKLSGLSTSYIRRLVSQGEIWGRKLGRNWVTTEQAVNDFLTRERRPGRKPKNKS